MWKVVWKSFLLCLCTSHHPGPDLPRTLLPGPHPTHISLPPSSPYPLPSVYPLSQPVIYFVPSRSWQIRHKTMVVSGRFFWIQLGTKLYPSRISEKRETTKVVSTISASMENPGSLWLVYLRQLFLQCLKRKRRSGSGSWLRKLWAKLIQKQLPRSSRLFH